jgi:hypothetical protein
VYEVAKGPCNEARPTPVTFVYPTHLTRPRIDHLPGAHRRHMTYPVRIG